MKLGFSTLGCPGWTLEQVADFAAKNNVDGVELRTNNDGNPELAEPEEAFPQYLKYMRGII